MRSCRDRRRQAPARSCPAEWLAVTPGKDARRTLARARPQGAIDSDGVAQPYVATHTNECRYVRSIVHRLAYTEARAMVAVARGC